MTQLDLLARLLRTAGSLPADLRYKLDVLDNTIESCGEDPNPACQRALWNDARERIREIECYLATQDGVVFPTPAEDPPTAHPSWSQSSVPPAF